ncbi:hypothetical protein ACOSQ3_002854 [Xanthoceras sorbifolium]
MKHYRYPLINLFRQLFIYCCGWFYHTNLLSGKGWFYRQKLVLPHKFIIREMSVLPLKINFSSIIFSFTSAATVTTFIITMAIVEDESDISSHMIFVAGKDKYNFLTGKSVKPATTSPTYKRWLADNAIVQGWLLGSITPKIMGIFIRLPTTQAIWKAVARTYYDGVDQSIINELNNKVFHMRQFGRPISKYYGELNTIGKS